LSPFLVSHNENPATNQVGGQYAFGA